MQNQTIARQVIESLPFSQALGMRLEEVGEGRAVLSMPWDARLVGDPHTGVIHGGAVSALMDTTAGTAVIARGDGTGTTATLDLRIDYMRPARSGQRLRCEAVCYHTTRTVAFIRATTQDEDAEAGPVATAVGAFTFERREEVS
ncbi:PaaI family thioesterase [Tropicimonas sp. IMCC6043]|uniref:PaaI family thioesterase n=1 Tax=Tropicimonas sp. IMCC6043 TaxID=2510645 RepID=UPI00101C0B73|nr:PaaI family thioesterase [Tropicimonas sp. IMCC6043]RYH07929.1 PaaI family thioesterase [Tropicimonas sp. IMCC6043]